MSETGERPMRRSTDQIFEGWTWGRVTKVGGALMTIGAIITAIISATLTVVATKPELNKMRDSMTIRFQRDSVRTAQIEQRLVPLEQIIDLIPRSITLQCLQLERDRSLTMARVARLPCDSLTR